MGADADGVKGAVVHGVSMVGAVFDGTLDTFVGFVCVHGCSSFNENARPYGCAEGSNKTL